MRFLLLLVVVLTGCSTTRSRIKERPEVYQKLPAPQQSLVTRGEVSEGMTRDAVYLAWGKADNITRGSDHGKTVEEWIYYGNRTEIASTYRPVPVSNGRYRSGWDYALEPVVVSSQYPYQSVRFENGRVAAWRKTPFGS